ncbi:MAG: hypothetical protein K2Z81_18860 [Cyanobacteria bacterium]|nr:hypothetical protein [Cyanobacteriota bacterium]
MKSEKFTIDDSLAQGWVLFGEKFWSFFGILTLAGFLQVLPVLANFGFKLVGGGFQIMLLLGLLGSLLGLTLTLGLINVQLRLLDGKEINSDNLWEPLGKIWAFLGASFLFVWMVAVGLVLFVVPGIILFLMFQFYPYFLVEHRLGPIQSLKASAAVTEGCLWELFFVGLLLTIFEVIGLLFLLIGSVPANVFKRLTITHVYRELVRNTDPESLPFTARI